MLASTGAFRDKDRSDMISALAGFLAGCVHVVSGPDHLSAVAPLAIEKKRNAWTTGLRWGLGHAVGLLLLGCGILIFREVLPIDNIASWGERIAALGLIAVGIWTLRKLAAGRLHSHEHRHDGHTHVHFHIHPVPNQHDEKSHTHNHAAFSLGTLHGVAGTSHLFGIMPALAFPSSASAVLYLSGFCVGAVLTMAGFSSVMGMVGRFRLFSSDTGYRFLLLLLGTTAVGVGGYWLLG